MIAPAAFLTRLKHATEGSLAVETAIVAPVLLVLSLGAFETSTVIARQTELQAAMAEAQSIALAIDPNDSAKRQKVQEIVMASTGLTADKVTIAEAYRCANSAAYVSSNASCAQGTVVSSYISIRITDSHEPMWNAFGLIGGLQFDQTRYVMYKQATKS